MGANCWFNSDRNGLSTTACSIRVAGISRWLVASMIVVSSGCAYLEGWRENGWKVGPNYCKPEAPVSEEWIDFNDPRVISTQESADESEWWKTFDDPVMHDLVLTAYRQNLPLRVAGQRVVEAQARRAIAAGLLLPQFQEAFAGLQHTQRSLADNSLGLPSSANHTFDLWSTGFNVGWELDVWGKFRRNLESADASLDASVENYDDILVSLIAETAAAYIEVRTFEQRLRYARENVKSQQGSLELAETRFRLGGASELDVTQAKSNLGQTEALIPVFEEGERLANNRLCLLLGVPPRDLRPEIGESEIPSASPEVVVGIPAELLRRRPDVRAAERQVAAQSALIGIATADLFPAFTINGSLNWQASKFSALFGSSANAGFIAPQFNWAILNYGRIVNNIAAENAVFQQRAVQYQQTVLEAQTEAENAIVSFLRGQEQVAALRRSVEATQRSVELVLTQYREGSVDFDRVFNVQSALTGQQDRLAEAEASVSLALVRLYKALGGGWQIRLVSREISTVDVSSPTLLEPTPMEPQEADATET